MISIKNINKIILFSSMLIFSFSNSAYANGLNNTQIDKLKTLGIKILVPKTIPNGYKVKDVKAIHEEFSGPGTGSHYEINYSKNSNNFSIESVAGGVGDIFSKEVKVIKTQFGNISIYKEDNCMLSSWIEYKNHFYRITSGNCGSGYYQGLSLSDTEKILKSLVSLDSIQNNTPKVVPTPLKTSYPCDDFQNCK